MADRVEFTFGQAFQDSMLALMLKDLSFCGKVIMYIPEERLFSDAHRYLFTEIKKKFRMESSVPSFIEIEDKLKFVEPHKRRMLRAFCEEIYNRKEIDVQFLKDKLTDYARKNAFVKVFQDGQVLYNMKRHEEAYEKVMEGINGLYGVSFSDDISIGIEEFEDVRQIYLRQSMMENVRVSTGIPELDRVLNGGLEKGELAILLAEPKKGKSTGLVHMGSAALLTGSGTVAHFHLEGKKEHTVLRYQSRLSGIEYNKILHDELTSEEEEKLSLVSSRYMGRLELIPMSNRWDYTVFDVDKKITELERAGKKPDLVIIDYADLLKAPGKHESQRIEQMWVYRYLKQMAMMKMVCLWTATQSQRPSDDPEKEVLLRAKHVADCYEKVRIADFVGTLNQTPYEKRMGILRFHLDIYRSNEPDRTLYLLVNFRKMVFYSPLYGSLSPEQIPSRKKKSK